MKRMLISSAVGLCVALSFGACGSSDSSSSSSPAAAAGSSTTATASASGGGDLAQIKQEVAKDEAGDATFPAPTEPFTPGSKKMMIIACSFTAPVCVTATKEAEKATKAMGWTTDGPQDGKFSPQVQSGLINKAIQGKYGGIIMYGIDVNGIKNAVDQAITAKIPIGCIVCSSGALRGKGGLVIDTTPDFTLQGEQMARYLIARNDGKAKVIAFEDTAYPQTVQRTTGIEQTLKSRCPGCTFQKLAQSVGEVAKPGPPTWTATLAKNRPGSVTDAVALFDGIGVPMAKTLLSDGRKDLVIDGYDADIPVVQALQDGSLPYGATIASPVSYATWGSVDQVGRVAAGKKPWDGTKLPVVTVTKDNAARYPKGDYQPKGDWRTNVFLKMWGK